MSDCSDILSYFTPLDELIQVVYQGSARFVILSSVDDASWNVHVGLTGDEGRWWRGRWTDMDVRNKIGQKVSSILLESFVENMANAFVHGNVTVGDWSAARGADIELVLGTTAKTPIRIPLVELSAEDAAAYATKVFIEIALQAQSRKCRLHSAPVLQSSTDEVPPKAVSTTSGSGSSGNRHARRTSSPSPEPADTKKQTSSPQRAKGKDREKVKAKDRDRAKMDSGKKRKADLEEAEEKIEALKVELEKTKRRQGAIMTGPSKLLPKNNNGSAPSRPKGASLANPTKKARKYQALEFESDGE